MARHESESVEAAVVTAPVYCAHSVLEPLGAVPEAMDPAPVPAPNDAGTTAPTEHSAQESPGPRVARQRSPEVMSVYQENLREKDRQTKVAEPPGQAKTWTPTRGQGKM